MKVITIEALEDVAFYMVMGMESELSDEEEEAIDVALRARNLPTGGAWASLEPDSHFGRCEVTGAMGNVVTVATLC